MSTSVQVLKQELAWLSKLIQYRMEKYFAGEQDIEITQEIPPPDLSQDNSAYATLIRKYNFNTLERVVLLMSMAAHLQPEVYDIFFVKNTHYDRGFTEFGGVKHTAHSGFIPTGETVAFVLSGGNLEKRFQLLNYFSETHPFHGYNILKLSKVNEGEPVFSGMLSISKECLAMLTSQSSAQ